MSVLFLHCLDCFSAGKKERIAVLVIDKESLHVVCENHEEPKHIYSVTIPKIERAGIECAICEEGVSDED